MMIKRAVLLAALLLLPSLALAAPVTYTTMLSFVSGPVPMTFAGASGSSTITPFLGPLGTFGFSCSGPCTGTDTFTITINQTLPGIGTGHLTATLSGIVAFNSSGTGTLVFGPATTITAGGQTTIYTGVNASSTINLAPLFAVITVPEPTAELLLALGSIGLFGLAVVSRTKIVGY
jgi:hypothetical protein